MSKAKLINVVLDLETVSTQPNAGILQIGAAIPQFDHDYLPSDFPTTFHATIRYEDVLALVAEGVLDMSDSTMDWWNLPAQAGPRIAVFSGQSSYLDALMSFKDWLVTITQASDKQVAVWGNDVGFDNTILRHSLDAHGIHNVWSYKNNRCFRTLRALFPLTERQEDKIVVRTLGLAKHTALGDALWEAEVMNTIVESYSGEDGLERWMI